MKLFSSQPETRDELKEQLSGLVARRDALADILSRLEKGPTHYLDEYLSLVEKVARLEWRISELEEAGL